MILVVSHPADEHAVRVLDVLETAGHPATLVDTSAFPARTGLVQHLGPDRRAFQLVTGPRKVDLRACGAGWWRRPLPYTLHDGIDPETASFAYSECEEALAGMWAALELSWMNDPALDERAQHKPYQLAVAARLGLPLPETLMTNSPEEARQFIDRHGLDRVVYKTFLATEKDWRETRLLRPEELELLDRVRIAPVIFQQFVPAEADVRVTMVGDRIFGTEIASAAHAYPVDYRMDMETARFRPVELPADVEEGLRDLIKGLGLVYGGIDLRRTPEGRYVFLEVNPAGEWLFVEERTGQPITKAVAAQLIGMDEHVR